MATSLENLNVKIGIDMSDLSKGIRDINSQFKQIDSSVRATSTGFDVMGNASASLKSKIEGLSQKITLQKEVVQALQTAYEKSIAETGKNSSATEALGKKVNDATAKFNNMELQLKNTNKELREQPNLFNKISESMKTVSGKMISLGKGLTLGLTAPLIGLATLGVKYNAEMEQYQAGLETMLGSADKATKMLLDLKTMANKTPFETTDLIKASQTMLAFGMTSESTMSALSMLGDVSMGNKDKLNSLTLAFAQVQSTGRLMGQDLLQMVDQGFNPLQIISEKTGRSMADLKKDMENGAISADMVTEAFKTATSQGGRFYGAMDKQSQTLTGKLSTLKDGFSQTLGDLTTTLLPSLEKIMDKMSQLVSWFSKLDEGSKTTILSFVAIAIAIGPIVTVLGALSTAIGWIAGLFASGGILATAFEFIGTVLTALATAFGLPVIAIVAIIAAVVAVGVAIFVFRDQIWDFLKSVWQGFVDFITSIPELLSGLLKIVVDFIAGIPNAIAFGLGFIIGVLIKFFVNIITGLATFISNIPEYLTKMVNFFWELPGKIWNALVNVTGKIGSFIGDMASKIANSVPRIINDFVNFFTGIPKNLEDIGKNIVEGLFNGIENSWNWLKDKAKGLMDSFVDGTKAGLGIHSPSTLFENEVGQWIPKGIAVGIDTNMDSVKKSLSNVGRMTTDVKLQSEYGNSRGTSNTYNSPFSLVIENFHNERGDSISNLNKELSFLQKKAQYATGGAY